MRIIETCGCGASIEVEDAYSVSVRSMNDWRQNHRHDSRALRATESDEQGSDGATGHPNGSADATAPCSTTASQVELAEPAFGFGGENVVTVKGDA